MSTWRSWPDQEYDSRRIKHQGHRAQGEEHESRVETSPLGEQRPGNDEGCDEEAEDADADDVSFRDHRFKNSLLVGLLSPT